MLPVVESTIPIRHIVDAIAYIHLKNMRGIERIVTIIRICWRQNNLMNLVCMICVEMSKKGAVTVGGRIIKVMKIAVLLYVVGEIVRIVGEMFLYQPE